MNISRYISDLNYRIVDIDEQLLVAETEIFQLLRLTLDLQWNDPKLKSLDESREYLEEHVKQLEATRKKYQDEIKCVGKYYDAAT